MSCETAHGTSLCHSARVAPPLPTQPPAGVVTVDTRQRLRRPCPSWPVPPPERSASCPSRGHPPWPPGNPEPRECSSSGVGAMERPAKTRRSYLPCIYARINYLCKTYTTGQRTPGLCPSCVFHAKVGSWTLCVLMESHRLVPARHTAITSLMWDVPRAAAAARYRLDRTANVAAFSDG